MSCIGLPAPSRPVRGVFAVQQAAAAGAAGSTRRRLPWPPAYRPASLWSHGLMVAQRGPAPWDSAAAGALASSTSAEASAARLGVVRVVQELQECPQRLAVWLLFDSRSLFASLQQPAWCIDNSAARETALHLGSLAHDHDVSVIWVPGHAGLEDNERADAAATTAREHADQSAVPISERALKNAVARSVECEALEAYRTALAGHTHLGASPNGGLRLFGNAEVSGRLTAPAATEPLPRAAGHSSSVGHGRRRLAELLTVQLWGARR